MQIRYPTKLTIEEFKEQQAWKNVELTHCPFHPNGGCNYAKHGTYLRRFPEECPVARYYCRDAHQTVALLPDFFASRLPGTLDEVEQAVNIVETSNTLEDAAFTLRPEINLPGGLRWLRRRVKYVAEILTTLTGLLPVKCPPELTAFRKVYNIENVLTGMRSIARDYLGSLPPIVGFGPRLNSR